MRPNRHCVENDGWRIGMLAGQTSLQSDELRMAAATPVECGRCRDTAKGSPLTRVAGALARPFTPEPPRRPSGLS
jgi:hypothetical protein